MGLSKEYDEEGVWRRVRSGEFDDGGPSGTDKVVAGKNAMEEREMVQGRDDVRRNLNVSPFVEVSCGWFFQKCVGTDLCCCWRIGSPSER